MSGYGDILGVEDIVGADIATGDEIAEMLLSGADIATGANPMLHGANRRHPGNHPHHQAGPHGRAAMLHALAGRHAAALTPRSFSKSREYTMGFSGAPVPIAGGAASVLKAQPQVPFKGRRLIIPSDVAGALIILNLIVGKNPVLVSADPVAARAYTELGVGVDLNMDTAQISQIISLSLQNTSGASVAVTPTLIGTAME